MKIPLVLAGIVLVGLVLTRLLRQPVVQQQTVRLSDLPALFAQLRQQGSDGSFAAFIFSDHGSDAEDDIANLQLSIENGRPGLDWVLLAPVNIRDEQRVATFLADRGSPPRRETMNDVTYLRVEHGDLARLCQQIMSEMYGVQDFAPVELVTGVFDWKAQ